MEKNDAQLTNPRDVEVQNTQEPVDQRSPVLLDSDGELQDVIFCLFCGRQNHSAEEICKGCGSALAGRAVERRLLMGRISTYANHAGQSGLRYDPEAMHGSTALAYILLIVCIALPLLVILGNTFLQIMNYIPHR